MSVDIRLKHSAQAGKVPDAGSLKAGEVAINTNDVKAYIKNSDGQVVQLAGADNPTTDGRYLRIDSGASAQTVASTDPTTFSGQVELPGGGGDTQALQKQEVEALIADPDGPADGNYLKLAADAGDQTVASTGTTTFGGLVEAGTGVNVTGGDTTTINTRGISSSSNNIFIYANNADNSARANIQLTPTGFSVIPDAITNNSNYRLNVSTTGFSYGGGPNARKRLYILGNHDCNEGTSADGIHWESTVTNLQDNATFTGFRFDSAFDTTKNVNCRVYAASNSLSLTNGATLNTLTGYFSNIPTSNANIASSFNFRAESTSPNFFAGHTYIGGDTTRNTLELWESTLTEEQREQHAAGMLAVPANVSTPGDGSFARQWWYDRQSAEDQELIDRGEREYPRHLRSENFVDEFRLGDNTLIDFMTGSNSRSGTARMKGVHFKSSGSNDSVLGKGIFYSSSELGMVAVNTPGSEDADLTVFLGRGDCRDYSNYTGNAGSIVPTNAGEITAFKAATPLITAQDGNFNGFKGFSLPDTNFTRWTGEKNVYAFYSNVPNASKGDDGQTYNIFIEGTAPSYFNGPVQLSSIQFSHSGTGTNIKQRGFYYSQVLKAPLLVNHAEEDDQSDLIGLRIRTTLKDGGSEAQYDAETVTNLESELFNSGADADDWGKTLNFSHFAATDIGTAHFNKDGEERPVGIGYLSKITNWSASGVDSYGFYAEGSAPNYFAGTIRTGNVGAPDADDTAGNASDPERPWIWSDLSNDSTAVRISQQNISVSRYATTKEPFLLGLNRLTNSNTGFSSSLNFYHNGILKARIEHQNSDGAVYGSDITITRNLDYRNFVLSSFSSTASSIVSQLNPGTNGFIAHELEEHIPEAVYGTKDATETIGTLADYDGTVIETEVTEPSADELTYTEDVTDTEGVTTQEVRTRTWTETGTRPVYQGVDQTKLIPLLTKALQEALERIEALESGGSSDFESRIAALEVDMARFKAI